MSTSEKELLKGREEVNIGGREEDVGIKGKWDGAEAQKSAGNDAERLEGGKEKPPEEAEGTGEEKSGNENWDKEQEGCIGDEKDADFEEEADEDKQGELQEKEGRHEQAEEEEDDDEKSEVKAADDDDDEEGEGEGDQDELNTGNIWGGTHGKGKERSRPCSGSWGLVNEGIPVGGIPPGHEGNWGNEFLVVEEASAKNEE